MTINQFLILDEDPLLAVAARDAMALFVPLSQQIRVESAAREEWTSGMVQLRSEVQEVDRGVRVLTHVEYQDESGQRHSRAETREAAGAGEDRVKSVNRLIRLNVAAAMSHLTGHSPGPWGILRGVRPTKLVHKMLDQGLDRDAAMARIADFYAVSAGKAALITDIALVERPFLPQPDQCPPAVSVYIGIPFCPSRCLYCSFPASVLPNPAQVEEFLQALYRDMEDAANILRQTGAPVEAVYIGGGTPTSLCERDFSNLLSRTAQLFVQNGTREFTVEAGRPDSITDGKIAAMQEFGVSRISVNPQTMQEKTLKHIGRNHTIQDIITIFGKIRHHGNFTINMDLIAGLPGETEADMKDTMRRIAALGPDNVTVHTLALKKGSALKTDLEHYRLPGEAVVKRMLEIAASETQQMGLEPYYLYRQKYMTGNFENIGYARPDAFCLYNIQIIEERQTIIGIGPGAGTKAVDASSWRLKSSYHPKEIRAYVAHMTKHLAVRRQLLRDVLGSGC